MWDTLNEINEYLINLYGEGLDINEFRIIWENNYIEVRDMSQDMVEYHGLDEKLANKAIAHLDESRSK